MAHGPLVPGGARAVSTRWRTGRQWLTGRQIQVAHGPSTSTGARAVSGSRAVRFKWHTGRQYPLAHGPSVRTWLTGRQSARGSRAVSPHVAHGPSVPGWRTGRQSPYFSWIVRLLARWSSVLGASRSAGWWWRVFGPIRPPLGVLVGELRRCLVRPPPHGRGRTHVVSDGIRAGRWPWHLRVVDPARGVCVGSGAAAGVRSTRGRVARALGALPR